MVVANVLVVVPSLVVIMVVLVVVRPTVVRVVLVEVATPFIRIEFVGWLRHLVTLRVRLVVILRRLVACWRPAARIWVVVACGKGLIDWAHSTFFVRL